jgi:hypothetical protein
MLEMIPARVSAQPGQVVTFACSFHSSEHLSLEFSEEPAASLGDAAWGNGGPPYEHALDPYQMGAKRLKTVAIRPELRSITCTARNSDNHVVGSISSMVFPFSGHDTSHVSCGGQFSSSCVCVARSRCPPLIWLYSAPLPMSTAHIHTHLFSLSPSSMGEFIG